MMKDRSSEFRRKANKFSSDNTSISMEGDPSINFTPGSSFLAEIDEIRNVMAELADDIASMKIWQRSILARTIVDVSEKEKLDECIAGIKHRTGLLRNYLMAMKEDAKGVRTKEIGGVTERIKQYHIEALTRKLFDLLELFNAAQLDYRAQVSKRIKRQLDIAGEHLTEDEVNAMVDSKSPEIFNRDARSLGLKSALDDASLRHNEILNLEESIEKLNDLYSELAFLVNAQGETVDRIDQHADDALSHVVAGDQQARVAVQYRKAELHKQLYCGVACAVFIAFLIIILIIYFSASSGTKYLEVLYFLGLLLAHISVFASKSFTR